MYVPVFVEHVCLHELEVLFEKKTKNTEYVPPGGHSHKVRMGVCREGS